MGEDRPPWEVPFVVDVAGAAEVVVDRQGALDLYAPPGAGGPRPAVVFVHGGPLPRGFPVSPRDWPVYRGYGVLAGTSGIVGVTVDHPLHALEDFPAAHAVVSGAVAAARTDPASTPIGSGSGRSPAAVPCSAPG